MGIIERAKQFLLGDSALEITTAPRSSPEFSAGYMRPVGTGGASALFAWNPELRDQKDDVAHSYIDAARKAIDAIHNSGWIAGAIDQAAASTVGTGLRLAPRPDRKILGWSDDFAEEWANNVVRRWLIYSNNPFECDAEGRKTVSQMTIAWCRTYYAYGEGFAVLPLIKREGSINMSKVKLILPHRLLQDRDDLINMFQGVRRDAWGCPLGYRILNDDNTGNVTNIAARDPRDGRAQVVHAFDGGPGQVRGITPLAPVLAAIRQYAQLGDATLMAALIQAIFAATIESDAPTADLINALTDQNEQQTEKGATPSDPLFMAMASWYRQTKIDLSHGGKIAHMFPGETLKFNRSEHPNENYEAFAKFLLREISRCLGMTFETFTGDYSGASYTSVRMAGSEIWPVILNRRANICARLPQAVYENWLQEEIQNGRITVPGGYKNFLKLKSAICAAEWFGPAKPQADDLKTAKAHEIYKRMGIMSDEMICSDLGYDYEDVYEQRAREMKLRERFELPDGDTMTPDPLGDALITEGDRNDGPNPGPTPGDG